MGLTNWDIGSQLRSKMENNINTSLQYEVNSDESTHQLTNIKSITITLEKSNWSILVESLLKEYRRLVVDIPTEEQEGKMELVTDHQADTFFVNRPINIILEREEEEVQTPIPQTMEIDSVLMPLPPVSVYPTESEKQSPIGSSSRVNGNTDNSNVENMVDGQRINSNKRKREDNEGQSEGNTENNSGNESSSENDEESEAEEKRLSLR